MATAPLTEVAARSPGGNPIFTVNCRHKVQAKQLMAKTNANYGRWFYCCDRDQNGGVDCKFFKWVDELSGPGAYARPSRSMPNAPYNTASGATMTPPGSPLSNYSQARSPTASPMNALELSPNGSGPTNNIIDAEDSGDEEFCSSQGSPRLRKRGSTAAVANSPKEVQIVALPSSPTPTANLSGPLPPPAPHSQNKSLFASHPRAGLLPNSPGTPGTSITTTAMHLDFLNRISPDLRSAHAQEIDGLVAHLQRQDRKLTVATRKLELKDQRIATLESELAETRSFQGTQTEIQQLKHTVAYHDAELSSLKESVSFLRSKLGS